MNEVQFRQLLEDYLTGNLSGAAQKQFFDLLEEERFRAIVGERFENDWMEGRYEDEESESAYLQLEKSLLSKIGGGSVSPSERKRASILSIRMYRVIAAAVLIFVAIGSAIWLYPKMAGTNKDVAKAPRLNKDVSPGAEGAILTLENGRQIILDSINSGVVAMQSGSSIVKEKEGLHYDAAESAGVVPVYNTITTPRGRQYPNLVLSDGTKVWLDASSSIRFPVAFTGNERRVEVDGQAWFEVIHNAKMPFKVVSRGVEIIDVGTRFNVKSYDDESLVKVTLLQGIVKVKSTLLSPGQQAQVARDGSLRIDREADLEEVSAWKNGRFVFNGADIQQVMQDLARWYDLEVVYTSSIKERFHLEITRNTNLSNVLKIMQATGAVHFKIEGRKITVMP